MTGSDLLLWLDLHRPSYFWLAGGLAGLALCLAVRPFLGASGENVRKHDWAWGLLLLAILLAGRWPTFLINREFNPDESQMLAGARVLWHDPVFWRAVDGGTAGPLDFFALWPTAFLFGWHSYLTTRIAALLCLTFALVLAHQIMALLVGRSIARVAGLAAVCLEALTNSTDLLHYSTELLPIVLLTTAGYAAVRRWVCQGGWVWNGWGGLLLGAVPLAKLQAVPLGAVFGLAWLVAEFFQHEPGAGRRRAYLVLGAMLPAALFACQLLLAGEWWNMVLPYYYQNVHYTRQGASAQWESLRFALTLSIKNDSLLHLVLPGAGLWVLLMIRPRLSPDRSTRIFLLIAVVSCVLAGVCIHVPGHYFLHYGQLLVIPLTFLIGATVANLLSSRSPPWGARARWLVVAGAVGLTSIILIQRALVPNKFIGAFTYFQQHPRSDLAAFVAAHSRPGESIAIWGWSSVVFVEADLLQAGRDGNFSCVVAPGTYQEYFRQRFLGDLLHARPVLFLDSTGPCSLSYEDPRYRHDQAFPELAAVIREQYELVGGFSEARLYRRRDGPAAIQSVR